MQNLRKRLSENGLAQCLLALTVITLFLSVLVTGHARDFRERYSDSLLLVASNGQV
jgi:hypothetical protein